jgi:hypothetical protein
VVARNNIFTELSQLHGTSGAISRQGKLWGNQSWRHLLPASSNSGEFLSLGSKIDKLYLKTYSMVHACFKSNLFMTERLSTGPAVGTLMKRMGIVGRGVIAKKQRRVGDTIHAVYPYLLKRPEH